MNLLAQHIVVCCIREEFIARPFACPCPRRTHEQTADPMPPRLGPYVPSLHASNGREPHAVELSRKSYLGEAIHTVLFTRCDEHNCSSIFPQHSVHLEDVLVHGNVRPQCALEMKPLAQVEI